MCIPCAALQVPACTSVAALPPSQPALRLQWRLAMGKLLGVPGPGSTKTRGLGSPGRRGGGFRTKFPHQRLPPCSRRRWVPGKMAAEPGAAACEEQDRGCVRPAAATAAAAWGLTPCFCSLPQHMCHSAGSSAGTSPAQRPEPSLQTACAPGLFLPTHISWGSHTHPRLGSLLEAARQHQAVPLSLPPTRGLLLAVHTRRA